MKLKPGHVTTRQAKKIGDTIGINWNRYEISQFKTGLETELEHGSQDPQTDVTHNDGVKTGKIAYAHLKEDPLYYDKLTSCNL